MSPWAALTAMTPITVETLGCQGHAMAAHGFSHAMARQTTGWAQEETTECQLRVSSGRRNMVASPQRVCPLA